MKKTQTSATVNFNSSELDNFRIFRVLMEGMGRLHMQPCGFSQCFTTNQMIPPFKLSLPLTNQADITSGVFHKAFVWQSPEIRYFFSWLYYYHCFCIKDAFTFNEMPGKKMNSSEKTSLKKLKQL